MNKLEKIVKEVISESTKVTFGGYKFLLKVSTNEDPQKQGIKVQFIPTQFGQINTTTQNDIAIELESRLERGLAEYGLRVERDRAIRDKSIISFFIWIEYFDRIIRKALENQNPGESGESKESSKLQAVDDIR